MVGQGGKMGREEQVETKLEAHERIEGIMFKSWQY